MKNLAKLGDQDDGRSTLSRLPLISDAVLKVPYKRARTADNIS